MKFADKSHASCNCEKECSTADYEKKPVYFVRPFKQTSSRIWIDIFIKELKWLGIQSEAQKLLILTAINLGGTIVLLIWCRLTASLALLAYTYLSWFNFLSLLTWLLSIWVKAQTASFTFTFGLIRCEIVAVFASVTFMMLGSLFILKESLERVIQPEKVYLDHLSCMAFVGFILNVVMTTVIQNPPLSHVVNCSASSLLQEHFTDMCHSLCLHLPGLKRLLLPRLNPFVLVSFVGVVFLVGNHIVVQVYNYPRCDTLVAFLIAILTMSTMYPLCVCSANLLLQTIPLHYSAHLDRCLREALTLDGVLEFHNERFWVLGVGSENSDDRRVRRSAVLGDWAGSIVAGSLHVRIRRDANDQMVLKHIQDRLKPLVPILTIQVYKDDWTRNTTTTTLRMLRDCVTSPTPIGEPKILSSNSMNSSRHPLHYQNRSAADKIGLSMNTSEAYPNSSIKYTSNNYNFESNSSVGVSPSLRSATRKSKVMSPGIITDKYNYPCNETSHSHLSYNDHTVSQSDSPETRITLS